MSFFYLFISETTGEEAIAEWPDNKVVNVRPDFFHGETLKQDTPPLIVE